MSKFNTVKWIEESNLKGFDENKQKLSKRLQNYPDPVEVFNNWMLIPAMHDNLHDAYWDRIGCGYEEDFASTFGSYWTVDFLQD